MCNDVVAVFLHSKIVSAQLLQLQSVQFCSAAFKLQEEAGASCVEFCG